MASSINREIAFSLISWAKQGWVKGVSEAADERFHNHLECSAQYLHISKGNVLVEREQALCATCRQPCDITPF